MTLHGFEFTTTAARHMWQVTLVILGVAVIVRLFCRQRPHLAYLLWMLVPIKCLVPPLIGSSVGLFVWVDTAGESIAKTFENPRTQEQAMSSSADESSAQPALDPPEQMGEFSPAVLGHSLPAQPVDDAPRPMGNGELEPAVAAASAPDAKILSSSIQDAPEAEFKPLTDEVIESQTVSTGRWVHSMTWRHIVLVTWVAGAISVLVWVVVKRIACQLVINGSAGTAQHPFQLTVERLRQRFGVKRSVTVAVTARSIGPAAVGIWRPTIVIPEWIVNSCRSDQLEQILGHELAHIRRRDGLAALLQIVASVLWWFHPLVWWANRRAILVRELCVDEEVLSRLECDRSEYAQTLIDIIARKRTMSGLVGVPGLRSVDVTAKRLQHIMLSQRQRAVTSWFSWSFALIALLLVLPGAERSILSAESVRQPDHESSSTQSPAISESDDSGATGPSADPKPQAADQGSPQAQSVVAGKTRDERGEPQTPMRLLEEIIQSGYEQDAKEFLVNLKKAESALARHQDRRPEAHVVYGQVVVEGPDAAQRCESQMAITEHGYFVDVVGRSGGEVGFTLHGYHPVNWIPRGRNHDPEYVGRIVMRPYAEDELAEIKGRLKLGSEVKVGDVDLRVVIKPGPHNTLTGGTNGFIAWPEKEQVAVNQDGSFHKAALAPVPHTILVRAPGHPQARVTIHPEPGQVLDLGEVTLQPTSQLNVEWVSGFDPDFDLRKTQTAKLAADQHWRMMADHPLMTEPYHHDLRLRQFRGELRFVGYVGGYQIKDLGVGRLEDFSELEIDPARFGGRDYRPEHGHVYVYHHRHYKHWSLFRVELVSGMHVVAQQTSTKAADPVETPVPRRAVDPEELKLPLDRQVSEEQRPVWARAVAGGMPGPLFLDEERLLVGMQLYDVGTGAVVGRIPVVETGLSYRVMGLTSNRRWLLISATERHDRLSGIPAAVVEVWDTHSFKRVTVLPFMPAVRFADVTNDGRFAVTANHDRVTIWDVEKSSKLKDVPITVRRIDAVGFSPDGEWLVVSDRNDLAYWRWQTEEQPRQVHTGRRIIALAFTPDSRFVAEGPDSRREIEVRNLQSLEVVSSLSDLEESPQYVQALRFSDDGRRLSAGNAITVNERLLRIPHRIHIWDWRSEQLKFRIGLKRHQVVGLDIAPSGRFIAAHLEDLNDSLIAVWQLED